MVKRPGMPETPRGGAVGAQRVLRIVTILVAVVGLTYLGLAYYEKVFKSRATTQPAEDAKSEGAAAPKGKANLLDLLAEADNEAGVDLRYNPATKDYELVRPVVKTPGEIEALYGPILDGATINSGQLHRLLKRVEKTLPASDRFMREAREVSLRALQENPQKYREMPVTLRGRLHYVRRVPFAGDFPEILEGRVLVGDEGFVSFKASRVVPLQEGQQVVIHGLFMQLVTEATTGAHQVQTPLVVTSHPLRVRPGEGGGSAASMMVTLVATLFVVYLVMMFWLRRKSQRRNPILEARRKVRGLVRRLPADDEPTPDDDDPEREAQGDYENGSP